MTALVTGSSRGIGAAIARRLAKDGMDIAINYVSNAEKAEAVAQECRAEGVKAKIYRCDVSDHAACKEMVAKITEELGSIDVLVNNAGITKDGLLAWMKEEQFDTVYQADLKSAFNLSQLVVSGMIRKRAGRIINISSAAGVYGNAGQCNYSAMKAGLIGFTKALSKEVGSRGITVNAVAPGVIQTDMTEALPEKIRTSVIERISLRREGKPEDIAALVSFLASEQSGYITGQCIQVDGGLAL